MSKNSHTRARARITPPKSADEKVPAHLTPAAPIAIGPNTTGHTDQVMSVHVDDEGVAPADAVSEIGHDEEG